MPKTRIQRRVMHRPDDLLEFVANVEEYPSFINLLSAIRVKDRKKLSDHVESFEAEATVNFKFISENFKSTVFIDREKRTIDVKKSGSGGAVKRLENNWAFKELADGSTLIDFYVSVDLKAFPLNMLLRDKFGKAGDHIMNLFVKRASQICETVGDPDLKIS